MRKIVFILLFFISIFGLAQKQLPESNIVRVIPNNSANKKNVYFSFSPCIGSASGSNSFCGFDLNAILRVRKIISLHALYFYSYSFSDVNLRKWHKEAFLENADLISTTKNIEAGILINISDKIISENIDYTLKSSTTTTSPITHWDEYGRQYTTSTVHTERTVVRDLPFEKRKTKGINLGIGQFSTPIKMNNISQDISYQPLNNNVSFFFTNAYSMLSYTYLYFGYGSMTNFNTTYEIEGYGERKFKQLTFFYFDILYSVSRAFQNLTVDNTVKRFLQDPYYYGVYKIVEEKRFNNYGFRLGLKLISNRILGGIFGLECGLRPGFFSFNQFYINMSLGFNLSANIRPFMFNKTN
ncbi:MAG: hypothetical protein NTX61_04625 [Bacteroidetes bacterium]|nr:hypothetical protein [Bacteroidota bacterium]